jgi:hypothetical protein
MLIRYSDRRRAYRGSLVILGALCIAYTVGAGRDWEAAAVQIAWVLMQLGLLALLVFATTSSRLRSAAHATIPPGSRDVAPAAPWFAGANRTEVPDLRSEALWLFLFVMLMYAGEIFHDVIGSGIATFLWTPTWLLVAAAVVDAVYRRYVVVESDGLYYLAARSGSDATWNGRDPVAVHTVNVQRLGTACLEQV